MSISSRFAVAVHILTLLEASGDEPVTSERIAASVNTNAVVIRRLLCTLAGAGLTVSRRGAGGGARLARSASAIRLVDVYRAVESTELFDLHPSTPNERCPVGRHIQAVLLEATETAQSALEASLAEHTVADLMARVDGLGVERAEN